MLVLAPPAEEHDYTQLIIVSSVLGGIGVLAGSFCAAHFVLSMICAHQSYKLWQKYVILTFTRCRLKANKGVDFEFRNITYSLSGVLNCFGKKKLQILHGVSGFVKRGKTLGIFLILFTHMFQGIMGSR